MKNRFMKMLRVIAASTMVLSMLAGCGASDATGEKAAPESKETTSDGKEAVEEAAVEDIEVWGTNTGYLPVEAGSELYNLYERSVRKYGTLGAGYL